MSFLQRQRERRDRKRRKRHLGKRSRRIFFETLETRLLLASDAVPGLEPVVLVPGFGGTFAKDESENGIAEWITHRGLPPDKLALEPHGQIYQNIVQTLDNVGYVSAAEANAGNPQTLFVALWDWRVPVAPVDGTNDGSLSVTASELLDATFDTGLDYLAHTLNEVKLANPSATHVDIITHSTGGLVGRAYLQSAAYGQSGLPLVDDFIMAGVPNEGVSDPWNFSIDDWSSSLAARAAARLVDHGYDRLQDATIFGPDPGSSADDITNAAISKDEFVQQYVGALRHLLPTYPAIDTDGDGVFETIDTSGPLVNDLLVDLNAGDPNAYIEKTGTTSVVYSTEVDTRDLITQRQGPDPRGFLTDEVLPFTNFIGRSPTVDQTWYEDSESGHGGDGTVSTYSSIDPFLKDARIGSKLHLIPITGAAANNGEPVSHRGLVINPYSQGLILDEIGVTGHTAADIESGLALSELQSAFKALELGIINPVEAFSEAASRFKELLTEAKTRGSLGANLAYAGVKLGEFLQVDQLWQDKVVTPLANSENNTVAGLVSELSGLGVNVTDVSTNEEKAIRFAFDASNLAGGVPTSSHTLDLRSDYTLTGTRTLTSLAI